MAVLAPVLDMEDDGARLVGEAEAGLDDADGLEILLAVSGADGLMERL